MGRVSSGLASFCLNRVATRVRVRSPPIESKPISTAGEEPLKQLAAALGRRIMVVADSSPEAKAALLWALSHAVQGHDTVVLLDVLKQAKHSDHHQYEKEIDRKNYARLCSMKSVCQSRRPEVHVELCLAEGKERGPAIVEEARKQGVALLVLGQKRKLVTWRLLLMWVGNRVAGGGGGGGGAVEYCIQNASCMTLAVRRKSRRGDGYLITTRRHKDFWLLA